MHENVDLQPLLDTQQNKLSLIMNVGASIDAKALGLFAAIITVLIFAAQMQFNLAWYVWVLLLGGLLVGLAFTVLALYPRQYIWIGADLEKHPEYYAMPSETLVLQLLADVQYAIEQNGAYNQQRWQYCVIAFLSATLGTLVLLLALLVL